MKISSIETSFLDYPNHTSMLVFMTGCKLNCKGCHNPQLQDPNAGVEVNIKTLRQELLKRPLCSAVLFTGGDPLFQLDALIGACRGFYGIAKIGVYTGQPIDVVPQELLNYINFLKTEPYIEKLGGLSSSTTNQKCWDVVNGECFLNTEYFKIK